MDLPTIQRVVAPGHTCLRLVIHSKARRSLGIEYSNTANRRSIWYGVMKLVTSGKKPCSTRANKPPTTLF